MITGRIFIPTNEPMRLTQHIAVGQKKRAALKAALSVRTIGAAYLTSIMAPPSIFSSAAAAAAVKASNILPPSLILALNQS